MSYLLIALAALALGPVMLNRLLQRQALAAALDGFVVVAITGLVFLHFVPEAVEERDAVLLACLVVGFVLPLLLERILRSAERAVDRWGLLLGITGLAIHAALDGGALATLRPGGVDSPLALALILHRLPMGIAVWWLASTLVNRQTGVVALAVMMMATIVGFYFGSAATHLHDSFGLIELYQALVAGTLVHIVMHPGHHHRNGKARAEGWGALAALALLLAVTVLPSLEAGEGPHPFLERLFVLFAESAPALLLAYLFAGLLSAFLPSASIRWLGKGGGLSQAGRGMLVGLPFPICSCGVVPLYRTLVSRGAPPAAGIAFLVATPELGVDAILLSIPLLGPEVTVLRLVTAGVVALLAGWWVGSKLKAHPQVSEPDEQARAAGGFAQRLRLALATGTGEIVDHTAPWILMGLAVAALVAPWLEGGWLSQLPSPVAVILFAALGFPTYLCAASATPLVATLLAAGLSPGAGIAFLITGPATNISTLGVLSSLHGRAAAISFATTIVALAVSAGLSIDLLFDSLKVPTLAELTEEAPSALQVFSLVGLLLLFSASVARRGIRRFVAEISDGLGWKHDHGHAHP